MKYTCPMHPEVSKNEPGKCPKCGMDLVMAHEMTKMEEPVDHTAHHAQMGHNFKTLFFRMLPLTIIVLLLSPNIQKWFGYTFDFPGRELALFGLGTIIYLYFL